MEHIYLDANSTTPMDSRVMQAMIQSWQEYDANPASQHRPGQLARRHLELQRRQILNSLGTTPGQRLIFTSGGTEANNLAIRGIFNPHTADQTGSEIIISAIEHPSVVGAAQSLRRTGTIVHWLPVDAHGVICLERLTELLNSRTRLVSIMFANNETGVIQPISEAAKICSAAGVPLHCDAVQGIGKTPLSIAQWGVSAVTLTAHKLHGPRGIGGLVVDDSISLQPLMFGGSQQLGTRPGTEDTALAAGFGKAVELTIAGVDDFQRDIGALRDEFEQIIVNEIGDCVVNSGGVPRVPHTSNLSFPGVNRQALLMSCDQEGVAISTGSACASGSSEPSPVLLAMGVDSDLVEGSIRVSLSRLSQPAEVRRAARRIIKCVNHLRTPKSRKK